MSFYPSEDLAYNAQVYVTVSYDNEELSRFNFKVRPLPVFISGLVMDQLNQPVAGVDVKIKQLNRVTRTNKDGQFTFGQKDRAQNAIPAGRYQLQINEGGRLPGLGTLLKTIDVDGGRLNQVDQLKLPLLAKSVGRQQIRSGASGQIFAGGDLQLDLANGEILFADGRRKGLVQVQFTPIEQLSARIAPVAIPHWMYSLQPMGIQVSGDISLDIKAPKLNGTYDYLPADDSYVLLLGLDDVSELIAPVGIGQIKNQRVISVGGVHLQRLDYLGYALVPPEAQEILSRYAKQEISLPQLMAEMGVGQ